MTRLRHTWTVRNEAGTEEDGSPVPAPLAREGGTRAGVLSRLHAYFAEMYPLPRSVVVGFVLAAELYLLTVLTHGQRLHSIGVAEVTLGLTLFVFLLNLRIADDFKDYTTDLTLFPERPLPSGRTKKSDLIATLIVADAVVISLNLIFVRNFVFFAVLVAYGILMSFWFFQRYRIQRSLVLALVTHNPVQLIMNLYVISYACGKYDIPLLGWRNVLILVTLYFPGLIWEIARKVRAPEDETEYVTYSKLFGIPKCVAFIIAVMFIDMITSVILIAQIYWWATLPVVVVYGWLVVECVRFIRRPRRRKLITSVVAYDFMAEGLMTAFLLAKVVMG